MKSTPMLIAVVLSLAACKQENAKPSPESEAPEPALRATAEVETAGGQSVGTATFDSVEAGVRIKFEGAGLPPGPHGIHVHEAGKCEGPDYKSAGGHFAPIGKQHGLENPKGHHAGDMPNLEVGEDGKGEFEYVLGGATLETTRDGSLLSGSGTALVIHAGPDDQKTDPSGDSGPRLACGVIEAQEAALQ
ncbi:Superoxide dismutase-like protein YojM precursor [Enhygromyxa salina]|uniref:Superoxide dismutase [Cu-Zn] n=1 Tax=Enhygromyxa salina TaxID=215803 RepID=A0A2S9YBT6_9BACT|nr:superoxide dismutase family protein [Enhygromyxa salina]PRQ02588.1 Superoxide dismutase-like protein YojM precursor [Enhygromyxa salina]